MTYEEYKNNKNERNNKTKKIISYILNQVLTIIIFIMIILIISNYSVKFRNFLKEDVLSSSMNFSYFNNIIDKITNIFKSEITIPVNNEVKEYIKYKDGVKYITKEGENVLLKSSGIITLIEEKEDYGNTIVVQQSDGYYAWYSNIEPKVKLYDYVEMGSVIGVSKGEYYYVLLKDNKPVNIDEY